MAGTAEFLRMARETQGLGLNETAELAGMSPSQLSRFERGETPVSLPSLVRLGGVLKIEDVPVVLDLKQLTVRPLTELSDYELWERVAALWKEALDDGRHEHAERLLRAFRSWVEARPDDFPTEEEVRDELKRRLKEGALT